AGDDGFAFLDRDLHALQFAEHLGHLAATAGGQAIGFASGIRGGRGIARHLFHGGGHLGHRGHGLFQFLLLLIEGAIALGGDLTQFLGGAVESFGGAIELGQGVALATLQGGETGEQLADLVMAAHLDAAGQIAFAHGGEVLAGFVERGQHAAGDEPAGEHREQQGQADQQQAADLGLGHAAVGGGQRGVDTAGDLVGKGLAGVGEGRTGPFGTVADPDVARQVAGAAGGDLPFDDGLVGVEGLEHGFDLAAQLGIADVGLHVGDQLAGDVQPLQGQLHAFLGLGRIAVDAVEHGGMGVGAGATDPGGGVVDPVQLLHRQAIQVADLLGTGPGADPAVQAGEQQAGDEQAEDAVHPGTDSCCFFHGGLSGDVAGWGAQYDF
ncbi:leucine-rich repeat receptor-like protein kinase, partial [Corchorus olitorius]